MAVGAQRRLPHRQQPRRCRAWRGRGSRKPRRETSLRQLELTVATQVRDSGPPARRQRQARRGDQRRARAGRAPAGGRREKVRRGHVHQLRGLPGAARPGPGPQHGAACRARLRAVAGRLRDRADRRSAAAATSRPAPAPAPQWAVQSERCSGATISRTRQGKHDAQSYLGWASTPQPLSFFVSCGARAAFLLECRGAESLGHRHDPERSHRVAEALQSVAWADERIVVDSGSTDDTLAVARQLADRVETRAWDGYASQKNHAASLASHDWILSLDADERVGVALSDEIRELLKSEPAARGYRVPRVTNYLGQWIRSTDWWPDWQCGSTTAAPASGHACTCTSPCGWSGLLRAARRNAPPSVRRHRRPSRHHRPLHDDCRQRALPTRPPLGSAAIRRPRRRWRFCATTSFVADSARARPGWSCRS